METGSRIEFPEDLHRFARLTNGQRYIIGRDRPDETLEGDAAFCIEFFEVSKVIVDQSTPETVIGISLWRNDFQFLIHDIAIGHRRLILQGHIDDSRIAANDSSCCTMRVIFAPIISRIIQVRMAVNAAREYVFPFCINHVFCLKRQPRCKNRGNRFALHANICGKNLIRCDNPAILHDQIKHHLHPHDNHSYNSSCHALQRMDQIV